MPKDKVETVNQRKTTRTTNVSTTPKSQQLSTRSKNEEVKKSREPSTDRNNLRKPISIENKTSSRKSEPINSKIDPTKPKASINKINLNKPISKVSSSTTKPLTKPVKALKPTTNTTVTSSRSSTIVPSKGTKTSTARDATSKRVTKEQYFPKKYPYSSYLHENEAQNKVKKSLKNPAEEIIIKENKMKIKSQKIIPAEENPKSVPKLSRERTMTRILSPSEVKILKDCAENKNSSAETSIADDRPRTATIRKHFNPDDTASNSELSSLPSESSIQDADNYNDYEDDFEAYESDFEAYSSSGSTTSSNNSLSIATDGRSTSDTNSSETEQMTELTQKRTNSAGTDDERKLDSGNYDLHDMKHKQILDNIKEAIEKENSNLKAINKFDTVNSLASLSDEGFEDGSKYLLTNNGFVNFMDAKKKQQKKKVHLKSRKRGEELMNMIRLNSVSFSLFDMEAISYEEFMQSYGRRGNMQVSAQTGDDDLDEEIQTEDIKMIDKETQFPIRFSKNDHLGDYLKKENVTDFAPDIMNTKKLNKFLETTGKLVLHILEQKETKIKDQIKQNYSEIPFSDGYLSINFEKTQFLTNRTVTFMTYSKTFQLLTIHENNIEVYMNENEQLLSRPTICIWNIYELIYPQHILVSSGGITRACFDSNHGYLIFGGINDGSISVWDLREESNLHRAVYDEQTDEYHIMRSATYTTTAFIDLEPCYEKVIALQSYHTDLMQSKNEWSCIENVSGIQVCTLTETGFIVIWSVIQKQATPELLSEDQGLVLWGTVILVQGLVISLQKLNSNLSELQCFDLQLHNSDTNHLFIASNHGVLHCLTSGMKPKPKLYVTDKSLATCVEVAPFSPSYFLSGCENGNIQLNSRFYEKPLMTLRTLEENNKTEVKIEVVKWLPMRPCVFFVKDDQNNLHIWDLMASDMYPIYSIPFKENISDIKLSPVGNKNADEPCYIAIACKEYGIRLHKISNEFRSVTAEKYKTELNTFLNYANRL